MKAASTALFIVGIAVGLGSCGNDARLPAVPLALAAESMPLDEETIRFYPDRDGPALAKLASDTRKRAARAGRFISRGGKPVQPTTFLAISGGGDDGAFGAGLLLGWSARGDRPKFDLVTGISTGALSAPFAFLGSEYDDELKSVYTKTSAEDIFEKRNFLAAINDDAMADTSPLRGLISRFVTRKLIQRIAEEYSKGRLLLIMTTNLDQSRPVIWNIGAIAASGKPEARDLIIDVLRASAAIPGVFPPVMLDVTIKGQHFQEMHVDGGVVAQAFLYPPTLTLRDMGKANPDQKRVAYIIRNGRLFRPEESVRRQTLSIAQQAISTMTATSGVNDMYRLYLTTKRDGVAYNLSFIDADFSEPYKGPFDPGYMNTLFQYGYSRARMGYTWHTSPPGYAE
jgi:predicted acylesterase/phospholipase RssA